jgi:membrane fusion protein, heavy metal efflux system
MTNLFLNKFIPLAIALGFAIALAGCKHDEHVDTAPPPAKIVEVSDMNLITIDQSDVSKFPIVRAGQIEAPTELNATGAVAPDISREVPVISIANGRVVDIKARLNDNVRKGQLLFTVQSPDVANAFNTYIKAVNDEHLANSTYLRAADLFKHGAISQAMLDQAEDAGNDAKSDLAAAKEQLNVLGVDPNHPGGMVHVYAPITGVIINQNITEAAAAGAALSGSANAFTIADLSSLWILCDVYENDLPKIQVGQAASIKIDGYPNRTLTGRVSDIGPVLDPALRTAKVRIQVANPGILRLGMFVTATFSSVKKTTQTVVPADAVLHLHDRDWVYAPARGNQFRRIEVRAGKILDDNKQQVVTGIQPGQQLVANALLLESAGNQ